MASISPICKKRKIFISALNSPTYIDFMIKKSLKSKTSKSHTWAPLITSKVTLACQSHFMRGPLLLFQYSLLLRNMLQVRCPRKPCWWSTTCRSSRGLWTLSRNAKTLNIKLFQILKSFLWTAFLATVPVLIFDIDISSVLRIRDPVLFLLRDPDWKRIQIRNPGKPSRIIFPRA